ncbi:hypothetical protein AB0J55_16740 [Amycolatopsis sp. NPDC049688]|uniref:hypothetical protein n=1 Tax=Amycolatopsis sp. NPDC049688 TaxID=3154733 RepID=UPI00341AB790
MATDEARLFEIKERAAAVFMAMPGVTGVGIGGRWRDGRPTGEVVLKVFVERKRPAGELPADQVLPERFEGVAIDVDELPPSRLEAGPPQPPTPGSPEVPTTSTDGTKYRPLVGGSRIEVDLTGSGFGTLGCFLRHTTDANRVFALTNFHVVSVREAGGTRILRSPTANSTQVGNPTNSTSSTKCCDDTFGVFVAGSKDTVRDAALVQLRPGTQYLAEVVGIGRLTGTHDITVAEAATGTYQVRKRGARTLLTGGVVEAINTTHTTGGFTRTNVTVVRPNPNAAIPATGTTYFSDSGDSGSVVVNAAAEVVALHFAGSPNPATKVHKGLELPIATILGLFNTVDSTAVTVATAATDGLVQTVPGGSAQRIPAELVPGLVQPPPGVRVLAAGADPAGPSPTPDLLAGVRARLDRSPGGRQVAALWVDHRPELVSLVNEHRRVAVVWQRNGGPALVQTLIRMTDQPQLRLPATVNGEPLTSCIDRIHDAFAAQAGPDLRHALGSARAALPDLAGLTYSQIVAALGAD